MPNAEYYVTSRTTADPTFVIRFPPFQSVCGGTAGYKGLLVDISHGDTTYCSKDHRPTVETRF